MKKCFFKNIFSSYRGLYWPNPGDLEDFDRGLGLTQTFLEPDLFFFKIWPRIQWNRSHTPENSCFWDNWILVLKNRSSLRPRCGPVSKYLKIIFSLIGGEFSWLKNGYFKFCCLRFFLLHFYMESNHGLSFFFKNLYSENP